MDRHIRRRRAQRRITLVFLALTSAGLSVAHANAADKKKQPLQFAFHVDVLKDAAGTDPSDNEEPSTPTEFNLVGVPLTFGSRQTSFEDGPGLAAGIYADYEGLLAERMTFTARAGLSKTKHLADGWGSDEASINTRWRYGDDDLALVLEPSWRLTVIETEVAARDYDATLRVENRLADGMAMVNSLRYVRHDATAIDSDWSIGAARTAFTYRLGKRASLDLAFDATYTLSKEDGRQVADVGDLGDVTHTFGPAVAMAFPLSDEIDLAATLRYCRTTDELPRFNDAARATEESQHLDMRLAWHNLDPMLRPIDISAFYAFDRLDSSDRGADTQTHSVNLALAVNF